MLQQLIIDGFSCLVSVSYDKRGKARLAGNGPSYHEEPSCHKEEEAQRGPWTLTRQPARALPLRTRAPRNRVAALTHHKRRD